jgi:hypothetical protein
MILARLQEYPKAAVEILTAELSAVEPRHKNV